MKIFLDTADINEIKKYASYGIVDGVTTNPSSISLSVNKDFYEIANDICEIISGDVSLEVVSNEYDLMVEEGMKISSIAKNVVIKLPMTWDGIKACEYFSKRDIGVNMTLCFSPIQALIAARSGAKYVSPFIGRLDDIGEDGIALIAEIREIYNNYNINTNILAASIRNVNHLIDAALCGSDYATVPISLMEKLLDHKLTTLGIERFSNDWKKSGKKI